MSTRDIDVIKHTILQNKIVSSDTISQFMEKCNNNFSAIIEFGGGPVGEKGEKGEDGVPTKPKVPIHVWKKGVDYDLEEEISKNKYKISGINEDLSDPKYQDGHLILLENAHVYVLELDNVELKPKFLTIFNTYNPYNDLEKNKAYVHIAYADGYYDRTDPNTPPDGFIISNNLSVNDEDPLNKKYIGVYTNDDPTPSEKPNIYKWSKIKGDKGDKGDKGEPLTLMEKTYSELVELIRESKLVPGLEYRITDFITKTPTTNTTMSAEHQFDIIVTAVSNNTFNEDAKAVLHANDTYFANCNIDSWELKYCIDNDTDRFEWADKTNGTGVIYYMKDNGGNEACYDFKNIMFKNPLDSTDDTWYYTFTNKNGGDLSLLVNSCYENKIGGYYSGLQLKLNNIIFNYINGSVMSIYNNVFGGNCRNNMFGYGCYNNEFGNRCYNNKFGNSCYNNKFGNDCYNNEFGNDCYNNKLVNYCYSNTFGDECYRNELVDGCYSNTFGYMCYDNKFGDGCCSNTLGDECNEITLVEICCSNTFGNMCCDNKFGYWCFGNELGNYCQGNTFGNHYQNIKFDNNCSYINITIDDDGNLYVQNYMFESVTSGTFREPKNYEVTRNNQYITKVSKTSDGTIRTYCEEDIQTSITYSKLVTLRNNSELIPGMQYRITDFVTTCNDSGSTDGVITSSVSHQFDIIVTADTTNTLNADARVCLHEFEDPESDDAMYFLNLNNKLSEWKIKYDINNDTTKYQWADTNTGKGVIYWMQDEFGNEACYDFKNILFDGYYTFNMVNRDNQDYSLQGRSCYENKIKGYYSGLKLILNNIRFSNGTSTRPCNNNTFDINCYNNTFGAYQCQYNTFGIGCYNNEFKSNCYNNTFGNDCWSNTFGGGCGYNTFGDVCQGNKFVGICQGNTFGNNCSSNTFGEYCYNNTFGNYCRSNKFGNYFDSNTFENNCQYIIFGSDENNLISNCRYNHFGIGCLHICVIDDETSTNYVQNYNISKFLQGTSRECINITTSRNLPTVTTVAKNSLGKIVYYCEADLIPTN